MILASFALAQQSGPRCPRSDDGYDAEVMILGAGMAGIAAAKTLAENGVTDFLIIEATDRIGGRIREETFEGVQIETGAHLLYQIFEEHPLFPFMLQCGIQGNFTDYTSEVVYNGSEIVPPEEIAVIQTELFTAMAAVQSYAQQRQADNLPDISMRQGLEAVGWFSNTTLRRLYSFYLIDLVYGEHYDIVSLYDFASRFNTQPNAADFFVSDARGYAYLLHCIAAGFNFNTTSRTSDRRLRLDTRVTEIAWGDECVCVQTKNERNINIEFCAKNAIITFSIGVLKSRDSMLTFNPPLPQWKRDTISHFEMTLQHKAFVKFNTTFWDSSEIILRTDERRGQYNVFIPLSGFDGKYPGVPETTDILQIFTSEELAKNFTRLTQNQLKIDITSSLREIYPDAQFEITNIFIPNWEEHSLFYGAWSHHVIGTTNETVAMLAAPVGNLYFSGEATSNLEQGTVQGAYIAGVQSANMVIGASGHLIAASLLTTILLAVIASAV